MRVNIRTISISGIVDDELDEANETVIITLSNPNNAVLGNDSVHTYTINDNDGTPAVEFSSSSSLVQNQLVLDQYQLVFPSQLLQKFKLIMELQGALPDQVRLVLSSGSVTIEEATSGTIVYHRLLMISR